MSETKVKNFVFSLHFSGIVKVLAWIFGEVFLYVWEFLFGFLGFFLVGC